MSKIVDEFQAIVDKLHSEGHIVATRLENALADLKAHFEKDKAKDVAAVEADVKKVETDAKPVVAEAEKAAATVTKEVKGQVEANLAEAVDVAVTK